MVKRVFTEFQHDSVLLARQTGGPDYTTRFTRSSGYFRGKIPGFSNSFDDFPSHQKVTRSIAIKKHPELHGMFFYLN